ncbi:uncharacterized protein ZBIST_1058 [Zygosaccharomyces bailii]|nr:uncharacterized protein ZBIST_1058 [Zygosaccharomyces bailii]
MLVTGNCKLNTPQRQFRNYYTWHLHELSLYTLPLSSFLIVEFTMLALSRSPETLALIMLKAVLCSSLIAAFAADNMVSLPETYYHLEKSQDSCCLFYID